MTPQIPGAFFFFPDTIHEQCSCRDKEFSITTDFSRLSVAIENPGILDFPCRDMGLMSRQCMTEEHDDRARMTRTLHR